MRLKYNGSHKKIANTMLRRFAVCRIMHAEGKFDYDLERRLRKHCGFLNFV